VAGALNGAERRARLEATRVYLVLSEAACRRPWREALVAALDSGVVGVVQVREKDLADAELLARAREVVAMAGARGALTIVNDRVGIVVPAGADGAHVGEHDLAPAAARRILGPDLLLGVSTHDRGEVATARARGADHAGLGPCFPSGTKRLERAPRGADLLRDALPAADLPVFPIGGITPENVGLLAAAGAVRVAVGAGVLSADDPAAAARAIAAVLRRQERSDPFPESPPPDRDRRRNRHE
jgi:thiamine-phosphate pyrophosphorylase